MKDSNQRVCLMKVATVWGAIVLLLLTVGALRTKTPKLDLATDADAVSSSAASRMPKKPPGDSPILKSPSGSKICVFTAIGGARRKQRFTLPKWIARLGSPLRG